MPHVHSLFVHATAPLVTMTDGAEEWSVPRLEARADRSHEGALAIGVQLVDPDPRAAVRRVDHLSVTDVHSHVTTTAREDQVTGPQTAPGDLDPHATALGPRRTGELHAGLAPGELDEAGAVEGMRSGGSVPIGVADVLLGHRDGAGRLGLLESTPGKPLRRPARSSLLRGDRLRRDGLGGGGTHESGRQGRCLTRGR